MKNLLSLKCQQKTFRNQSPRRLSKNLRCCIRELLPQCRCFAIRPIFVQLYRNGNEHKRIQEFNELDYWVNITFFLNLINLVRLNGWRRKIFHLIIWEIYLWSHDSILQCVTTSTNHLFNRGKTRLPQLFYLRNTDPRTYIRKFRDLSVFFEFKLIRPVFRAIAKDKNLTKCHKKLHLKNPKSRNQRKICYMYRLEMSKRH